MAARAVAARSVAVERALAGYCRQRGLRFTVDGDAEAPIRVLSPEMFLPIVMLHAEMGAIEAVAARRPQRASLRPRFPLGSAFRHDDEALFQTFVDVPALTGDGQAAFRSTMLVLGLHKVFGWSTDGPVEVAGVYERYQGSGLKRALDALSQEDAWTPAFPH